MRRLEQRRKELVKIHCSLASDAQSVRRCAQKRCDLFRCALGECQPGWLGLGPTVDSHGPPLINDALQTGFGSIGEQSERIPIEVNLSRRQMKFAPKARERVNLVELYWIRHGLKFEY